MRSVTELSEVFTVASFGGGYGVALGMFKRGEDVDGQIPELRHVLIAFGGLASLEQAFKVDAQLAAAGVTEPCQCFDFWVDTHHPHRRCRVGEGVQSVGKSERDGKAV